MPAEYRSPDYPNLVLREASLDDGIDVWSMIREIGPGENGFGNEGHSVAYSSFQTYLQGRIDMRDGADLPDGRVPMTTYWLFRRDRPVAMCKLRHHLTDSLRRVGGHIGYCVRPSERRKGYGTALLALALQAAGGCDIPRLLITCNSDNLASRRIAESNGGVLEGVVEGIAYYWVETTETQCR